MNRLTRAAAGAAMSAGVVVSPVSFSPFAAPATAAAVVEYGCTNGGVLVIYGGGGVKCFSGTVTIDGMDTGARSLTREEEDAWIERHILQGEELYFDIGPKGGVGPGNRTWAQYSALNSR